MEQKTSYWKEENQLRKENEWSTKSDTKKEKRRNAYRVAERHETCEDPRRKMIMITVLVKNRSSLDSIGNTFRNAHR